MYPAEGITISPTTTCGSTENIAMDTGASIQVHASSEKSVFKEAATFLDSDVNHCLGNSHDERHDLQAPGLTPRDLIVSRQYSARRLSAARGLVLPSIQRSSRQGTCAA